MDTADPPFPRSTSVWWFDCQSISHKTDPVQIITPEPETSLRNNNSEIRAHVGH